MTMCTYCISHKLKSKLLAPTDYNQNADYFISEIYSVAHYQGCYQKPSFVYFGTNKKPRFRTRVSKFRLHHFFIIVNRL